MLDRVAAVEAAVDALAAEPVALASHRELIEAQVRLEVATRRVPAITHPMVNRLATEASPISLGGKTLKDVLARRLRIRDAEAKRRIDDAEKLGPRATLTGEPLPPLWPTFAAAQRQGLVGEDHLAIVRKFFKDLPADVDYQTRERAEQELGEVAATFGPHDFEKAAQLLAYLLNQDGRYSEEDRAKKRGLTIGKQDVDGMTKISGNLDPEALATWEPIFAKLAAPGMCNRDEVTPCVDGEPSEEQVTADTRTLQQRQHDAFLAAGRAILASGELGQHNGLPASIFLSVPLQDLENGTGFATTGGGSKMPIHDVIRVASQARPWLLIFDKATEVPLHLFRSHRFATPGQRLVLYSQEGGCSFPGCTVPAHGCQVHHAVCDWADGGLSNVTDETLACPKHNRFVNHGWVTRKRRNGTTEWHPPPELDYGQPRVNYYWHPEKYFLGDENNDDDAS